MSAPKKKNQKAFAELKAGASLELNGIGKFNLNFLLGCNPGHISEWLKVIGYVLLLAADTYAHAIGMK